MLPTAKQPRSSRRHRPLNLHHPTGCGPRTLGAHLPEKSETRDSKRPARERNIFSPKRNTISSCLSALKYIPHSILTISIQGIAICESAEAHENRESANSAVRN